MRHLIAILALSALLAGCDVAPPPDKQSADAQKAAEHTELRDAINTPLDKAKTANAPNEKHDEDQRKAVDDQGG